MAAHNTNEYAFKTPYSQSSYDNHPNPTATTAAPVDQHGTLTEHDDDYDEGRQKTELYSNTLNNTNNTADSDYPTRGPHTGSAPITQYADPGYGQGSAAYGRKGIWTPQERSAFSRRSAPVKIIRTLFCILLIGIIIALSAILLIITFARPPNVGIGAITANSTVPDLGATSLGFNVSVDITVSNPNDITATLTQLTATAYDSVSPKTPIGSGKVTDIKIGTHANTTFVLPFQIAYDSTKDPNRALITDLATKCGWLSGGSPGKLNFTFNVDAHLSVLSLAIPFSFSVSPDFTCPISASTLSKVLGSAGGSLDEILKALGVIGSRRSLEADDDDDDGDAVQGRDLLTAPTNVELGLRDIKFANMLAKWRERRTLQDSILHPLKSEL
ncbi:hypothetical protein OC846_003872 [Tilletia horrida]|uniref:Late embryogenesis abundant protein LEA-2 subgroup domain-containing protein n=1 Tax=Tilletia horrida TaxID=155126 RepID=A0AAN6JQY4_9BASI|nr:hypothetical protein OC846_003872 [Tilletia horrida]KAK0565040.1 hypothetical protein OC861_003965 [Tilletia horrida]